MDIPTGFNVCRRNYGHWDIGIPGIGRVFCIRGGPGKYYIRDERPEHNGLIGGEFNTLPTAMAYICDILMYELIVAEGQKPYMIEEWNV